MPDAASARRSANLGSLVVEAFEIPDVTKSGHIAIVRPGTPDQAALAAQGPDVTQAGTRTAPSFEDAVTVHRIIAAIEKAAESGTRVVLS